MGTIAVSSIPSRLANAASVRPRDLYIDRLRSIMTAQVIVFHAALTYGAIGSWFWRELKPSMAISSRILQIFTTTSQAYFTTFFFFLAAYFTAPSLERKGYGQFIGDRWTRLGFPLLAFILVLAPFTHALAHWGDTGRFWETFPYLWRHVVIDPGPMWFVEALLLFSMAYCAWRAMWGARLAASQKTPRPIPSTFALVASALATGLAALLIRQKFPVGVWVPPGFLLCFFAPYVALFAAGIAAWRYDWLRQLEWRNVRTVIWMSIAVWPLIPIADQFPAVFFPVGTDYKTGFSWPAVRYALWEPLVAWGFIAGWLLLARGWMNQPSPFWSWVNRRAYTVYIIHPPVLVGVALLLHPWAAPALVKWAVTGTLAVTCTWLVADPLVRLPGLRRVL